MGSNPDIQQLPPWPRDKCYMSGLDPIARYASAARQGTERLGLRRRVQGQLWDSGSTSVRRTQ